LDIPDDLLFDIFTIYLRIEHVCGLDSALCNKRRRAEFLELVSRRVLLFNREEIAVLGLNITTIVHRCLGAAALRWILKRGIHLASIRLSDDVVSVTEQQSIRESVGSLALNGSLDKLETIDVYMCSYIKDADLAAILSKCYRSMKGIDIWGCGLIGSSATHIKRCTKLEAFAPNGNESAAELVAIFQACRKLRKANLSVFGDKLTDETLQGVAAQCPLLEHVKLVRCAAVSDVAIQKVSESCLSLQYIDLQITNIGDLAVISLCKYCPLLKRLLLTGCRNLTDIAVMAVAEKLPAITHIGLGGIDAITSRAVETLVSKCCDLELINIGGCVNVSDDTLFKLAEHCSKLRELCVSGCSEITPVGLALVASKCLHLKTVSFKNCNEISAKSAASLERLFPLVSWKQA
jgi:hypothetical protein